MSAPLTSEMSCSSYLVLALMLFCLSQARADLDKLKPLRGSCLSSVPFCTLLLGRDKKIGCSQCGESHISRTVRQFEKKEELEEFLRNTEESKRVIFISRSLFTEKGVLQALRRGQRRIASVVVAEDESTPERFSTELRTPNFNFTKPVTGDRDEFAYNVFSDDGAAHEYYPFNIFQVDRVDADRLLKAASRFGDPRKNEDTFPRFLVESRGLSWSCDRRNSEECLKDGSCHPVGGRSAWAALNGINDSLDEVLAITAPMDSSAFFHDLAFGVSAELSSLAVLMTVVESIGRYVHRGTPSPKRNIAFFAFNAEAWGFSGSRRFMKDVETFECKNEMKETKENRALGGACRYPPMNSTKFMKFRGKDFKVLSIGSLGKLKGNEKSLYLHGREAEESAESLGTVLKTIFEDSTMYNSLVSSTPLTAAHGFVKRNRDDTLDAFAVADYEKSFTNKFYHSQFDNNTQELPYRAMSMVARNLTRAIVRYVFDDDDDSISTDEKTAKQFVECFAETKTWTKCGIAREYLGSSYFETRETSKTGTGYPGLYLPETSRSAARYNPSAATKEDLVKAFMAYHTRIRLKDPEQFPEFEKKCEREKDCSKLRDSLLENESARSANVHCIRSKCIVADAYLHNAYGPGLNVTNENDKEFEVIRGLNANRPQDAVWTETYWDDTRVCFMFEDSKTFGVLILLAGIGVLIVSLCVTIYVNFLLFRVQKVSDGTGVNRAVQDQEPPRDVGAQNGIVTDSTAQTNSFAR